MVTMQCPDWISRTSHRAIAPYYLECRFLKCYNQGGGDMLLVPHDDHQSLEDSLSRKVRSGFSPPPMLFNQNHSSCNSHLKCLRPVSITLFCVSVVFARSGQAERICHARRFNKTKYDDRRCRIDEPLWRCIRPYCQWDSSLTSLAGDLHRGLPGLRHSFTSSFTSAVGSHPVILLTKLAPEIAGC